MQFEEFGLNITTAPTVEPLTATQVKLATRVSEAEEDALIESWITTARQLAETYQRRAFLKQTIRLTIDRFPCDAFIRLPRSPLIELKQMSYFDTANTETIFYSADAPVGTEDNYIIDTYSEPARVGLAFAQSYPTVVLRPYNGIIITYDAGYGETAADVPESVKDAIYVYCAWRYENRAAETNEIPAQFWLLLDQDRIFL